MRTRNTRSSFGFLQSACALAVLAILISASALAADRHFPKLTAPATLAGDRALDTEITWERSVSAAAETARRQGKLVFLIHVSGDFEQPEFT